MKGKNTVQRLIWAASTAALLLAVVIGVMLNAGATTQTDAVNVTYQSGDVNDDSSVNMKDLTRFKKYLADQTSVEVREDAVDMNGDGNCNSKDLARFKRWLAQDETVQLATTNMTVAVEDVFTLVMVDGEYCITECKGNYTAVTIPKTYNGIAITKISAGAFSDCDYLTGVTFAGADNWKCGSTELDAAQLADPTAAATYLKDTYGSVDWGVVEVFHAITYRDYKTADISNGQYKEGEGVDELPVISADGYKFIGWVENKKQTYTYKNESDIPSDLVIVDYIPMNSTKDYTLYAYWMLETYTITYKDAPVNNNPTTYTIEDKVYLSNPEWSGLKFSHWEYVDGTRCDTIDVGTTGDIELTAHYTSFENYVTPATNERSVLAEYDETTDTYYFLYELGTIENIVLGTTDSYVKTANVPTTIGKQKEVTLGESVTESTARVISQSVSQTAGLSEVKEWAKDVSNNFGVSVTAGVEVDAKVVKANFEATVSGSTTTGSSWSGVETISNSDTMGTEEGIEVSSAISYQHNVSKTCTLTQTIDASLPNGKYSCVYTSSVCVYALVIYVPSENGCYLATYSVMDDEISEGLLYEPLEADKVNIVYNDQLAFTMSDDIKDTIEAYIDNSYYVRYDANGGQGLMYKSCMITGEKSKLALCKFEKYGYRFKGWNCVTADGVIFCSDGSEVCDLAAGGETITLYADWEPLQLTIEFKSEGGIVDTTNKQVTYNAAYGTLPTPTRTGYTFAGWYTQPNKGGTMVAKDTIVNKANAHTLYAGWNANSYKATLDLNKSIMKGSNLPTCGTTSKTLTYDQGKGVLLAVPVTTNEQCVYVFDGWYTAKTGGTKVTGADGKLVNNWNIASNTTLYAHWSPKYQGYTYISTATEFANIKNNPSGNYMLVNDINLGNWNESIDFKGVLDGNGYTVTGNPRSYEISADYQCCGYLFRYLYGTVRNLTIKNVTLTVGTEDLAGLNQNETQLHPTGIMCGYIVAGGVIENCTIQDSNAYGYHCNVYLGGFAGGSKGTVMNSTIKGTTIYGYGWVSGVIAYVGENGTTTISGCTVEECSIGFRLMKKSSQKSAGIGGLVGYSKYAEASNIGENCELINNQFVFDGTARNDLHGWNIFGGHHYCEIYPYGGWVAGYCKETDINTSGLVLSGNKVVKGANCDKMYNANGNVTDPTASNYWITRDEDGNWLTAFDAETDGACAIGRNGECRYWFDPAMSGKVGAYYTVTQ